MNNGDQPNPAPQPELPGQRLTNKIRVRLLEPDDSLAHLTGMLHRAYKQHADKGIKALAAFQPEEVTRKRVADGECYVALFMGKIVGTILFRRPGGGAAGGTQTGTPWFSRTDVATFSQFAVEPEYQGRGIGSVLMSLVERRAAENGASELALSTPEPAAWLVMMYERHAYRIVERVNWNETNYTSVIMSKAIVPTIGAISPAKLQHR
ncbi:MAG: GNAT family N-acetyltransferase [Phycisphaerales bacterium]|nr:GNAT family N-acetyltransferase [Phycisphaerales bacterium]